MISSNVDHMLSPNQNRLLEALNDAMIILLSRKNAQSRAVSAYLHKLTLGFQLDIEEFDLLHLAYERTRELIAKGNVRNDVNLIAYLKKVASYIAYEKRRTVFYYYPLNEEIYCDSNCNVDIDHEFAQVSQAMNQLSDEDQYLLHLKIVANLPWKVIHQLWIARFQKDISIPSLRKRKERALVKLRLIYHNRLVAQ